MSAEHWEVWKVLSSELQVYPGDEGPNPKLRTQNSKLRTRSRSGHEADEQTTITHGAYE